MVLLFPSVASVDQPVAGVDILDINIGAPGIDEVSVPPEIAPMVVESIDRPIYLISANRGALAVIVSMCPGKS
jgi:5-methyltetrahydrofolate--homocysteine methyltransferase